MAQRPAAGRAACWATGALLLAALGHRAMGAGEHAPTPLRIGYAVEALPEVDPQDARLALEVWAKQLSLTTQIANPTRAVDLSQHPGPAARLRRGEVDIASVSSVLYLRNRGSIGYDPALVAESGGTALEEFVLLVRRSSGIRTLAGLKGKRLSLQRGNTRTSLPRMWLEVRLAREKLPPPAGLFAQTREVARVSQVVLPVFFGQMDACLVSRRAFNTMAELNPQLGKELVEVARSPGLLLFVVLTRRGMDRTTRERFANAAPSLDKTPAGRQILTLFQVEHMAPFQESHLASTAEVLRAYDELAAGR